MSKFISLSWLFVLWLLQPRNQSIIPLSLLKTQLRFSCVSFPKGSLLNLWSRFVVCFELAVAQSKARTQHSFAHTSNQRSGCSNFSPWLPVMFECELSSMGLCVWIFSPQLVALFWEAEELLGCNEPWLDEEGPWGHAFKVMAQLCFQSCYLLCDLPWADVSYPHYY